MIPSISAVTGISPGRYLWRVVIAFHIGPRILIAAVYYNFLMSFVPLLAASESVSSAHNGRKLESRCQRPTANVIPVFITGRPVIIKWGDHSAFNIPIVVLKDIQQLWECRMYHSNSIL